MVLDTKTRLLQQKDEISLSRSQCPLNRSITVRNKHDIVSFSNMGAC